MSFWKIYASVIGLVAAFSMVVYWMTTTLTPDKAGVIAQYDITIPRAPSDAKKLKNPIEHSLQVVAQGEKLYHGKGMCVICHGEKGYGDGPSGKMLHPPPRDFTDGRFQRMRTDGELFWVTVHGSSGTGMLPYTPRFISEEEAWMVVYYLRTLSAD